MCTHKANSGAELKHSMAKKRSRELKKQKNTENFWKLKSAKKLQEHTTSIWKWEKKQKNMKTLNSASVWRDVQTVMCIGIYT